MSAFACDRCGRGLLTDADVRYKVEIRVTSAYDPLELTEADLQADHAAEMARLLESLEGRSQREIEQSVYAEMSFDLCATCHPGYLKDPLGAAGPQDGDPQTGDPGDLS